MPVVSSGRALVIVLSVVASTSLASAAETTPYGDGPHAIPGRIEAEHYDKGQAGVAYHDVDADNQGVDYREQTQVDIEQRKDASNGHGVGWTRAGEWLTYTVAVQQTGEYTLEIPVASNKQGGTFHVEMDGTDVTGPIRVPDTGGWQNLKLLRIEGVPLVEGIFTMKLVMDAEGPSGSIADIDHILFVHNAPAGSPQALRPPTPRPAAGDEELRFWLTNMVGYHDYAPEEVALATGLSVDEITTSLRRWEITSQLPLPQTGNIVVLPYPGGRHPRVGFLEGAIDPQRETKVSVFTPWQESGADYVVVDVPEAIWSNLGLTYLAHTHVPTVWSQQGIEMEPLEWTRGETGKLNHSRTLPNGIAFSSSVQPRPDHVRMRMTLTNGTEETLTGLRVQMCAMLKGAQGFDQPTNANKILKAPYSAVHDPTGKRWIISAWMPNQRTWANPRCPCLHSDPQFPDCASGQTETIAGWFSFYEGADIDAEIERINATEWWTKP